MTKEQNDYTMTKSLLTRLTNTQRKKPRCMCGCGREIKIGDEVHSTTSHSIYLLEHFKKLLH